MQTLPQPTDSLPVSIDSGEEKPYQAISQGIVHVLLIKRNSYIFNSQGFILWSCRGRGIKEPRHFDRCNDNLTLSTHVKVKLLFFFCKASRDFGEKEQTNVILGREYERSRKRRSRHLLRGLFLQALD